MIHVHATNVFTLHIYLGFLSRIQEPSKISYGYQTLQAGRLKRRSEGVTPVLPVNCEMTPQQISQPASFPVVTSLVTSSPADPTAYLRFLELVEAWGRWEGGFKVKATPAQVH